MGQWLVIANAKRSSVIFNGPIDIATLELWMDEGTATARASALLASGEWTDDGPPESDDRTGFVAKFTNVKRSELHQRQRAYIRSRLPGQGTNSSQLAPTRSQRCHCAVFLPGWRSQYVHHYCETFKL